MPETTDSPEQRDQPKPKREPLRKALIDALIPDFLERKGEQAAYTPEPLDERDHTPPTASPQRVKRIPGAESVKKNTIEVLMFRGLATPLAFLLVVIQSRFLEPSGRGAFVLAVLTVTVFSRLLGDLGTATTNQISAGKEDVGELTAGALRLAIGLGLACSLLIVSIGRFASDIDFTIALLAALALTPSLVTRTLSGVLLGTANIRLWNWLQITPAVVGFTALVILVVVFDTGVEGAVVAWTLGHVTASVIGLVATRGVWWRWLTKRRPRGSGIALLRLALSMGAANVIALLNYRIELFILSRYTDLSQVGIYSISVQVAESLWLVTTAFATAVWAPAIHESEERAAALIARSAGKALLYISLGAGAIIGLAPFALPLIFGDKFEDSVRPTLLLVPGIVLYGPVAILTIYLSVRKGRAMLTLAGPLVSLVITASLAFLLIPDKGANGAAIASSVGYAVSAIVVWAIFVRVAGLRWHARAPART